ncbi:hypothetical protein IWQ47_004063 [Aquimarina sp. EL_43]|nr:hypothetical protein [Aquimarina sp. EL_35]MBG6152969.1 hypothetical protein [Aquimarina sp. EL_32]MBG6170976.1 hypothetical protein [Aquimarina sp. EL_43]
MDQKDASLGSNVSNLEIRVPKLGVVPLILENRDSNLDYRVSKLALDSLNFYQKDPTEGQKDQTIDEQHTNFK